MQFKRFIIDTLDDISEKELRSYELDLVQRLRLTSRQIKGTHYYLTLESEMFYTKKRFSIKEDI